FGHLCAVCTLVREWLPNVHHRDDLAQVLRSAERGTGPRPPAGADQCAGGAHLTKTAPLGIGRAYSSALPEFSRISSTTLASARVARAAGRRPSAPAPRRAH